MASLFCCGNNQMDVAQNNNNNKENTSKEENTNQQQEQIPATSQNENNSKNVAVKEQQQQQTAPSSTTTTSTADQEGGSAVAWSISFAPSRGAKAGGGKNKKEKAALEANRKAALQRRLAGGRSSGSKKGDDDADSQQASASASDVDQQQNNNHGANDDDNNTKKKQELDVVEIQLDESVAVPRDLTTTREDLLERIHLDMPRYLCVPRQYKRSCGVSSLTAVWNSLYSRIGHGELPPVSQEEVMTILGFAPPLEDIRWGPYTGNTSLMRWFHKINKAKGVTLGRAFYFWKPHGTGRTIGLDDERAEEMTCEALKNPKMAIIYHCLNHYFVPVGFRRDPIAPRLSMLPKLTKSETNTKIFIGEPSRGASPSSILEIPFSEIAKDLHTEAPYRFNIRHRERGVEKREKCKKTGGTLHCFIGFRSDLPPNEEDEMNDEEEDEDEDDE